MEYQKITNFLDKLPDQLSKFKSKNWFDINDDSRGTHSIDSQIKVKTSMLKLSLCNYIDASILVKGTVGVPRTAAAIGKR